jgi:hypothetical protein
MTGNLTTHRFAVPPPGAARNGRNPTPVGPASTPSASAFVARVIFIAIAVVMATALIAVAPRTVTIPIAVAAITGLTAGALVMLGDGRLVRRPRRRGADGRSGASAATAGWGVLGATSLSLLLLALVLPQPVAVPLAAVSLGGLVLIRLAAFAGSMRRRPATRVASRQGIPEATAPLAATRRAVPPAR